MHTLLDSRLLDSPVEQPRPTLRDLIAQISDTVAVQLAELPLRDIRRVTGTFAPDVPDDIRATLDECVGDELCAALAAVYRRAGLVP